MNINWIKLKSVTLELRSINRNLDRIASCMEADLHSRQIPIHLPPQDQEPPDLLYTNEEDDYIREMEEMAKRAEGKLKPSED